MKDWTGNRTSIFKTLGASNHTDKERQSEDFYATDPFAAELLLGVESFSPNIWEPACGQGHLAEVFKAHGYNVRSTDIVDRGYGEIQDFLGMDVQDWDGDIITNPPYKYAQDFIEKALTIIPDGRKVAMFLKVQFLEGKARRVLYDSAPPPDAYMFAVQGFYAPRTACSTRCATRAGVPLPTPGSYGRKGIKEILS